MLRPGEPEAELVFHVARHELTESCKNRLKDLVRSDLDWDAVIRLASGHGILSRLYTVINSFDGAVPSEVNNRLETLHRENALRNLEYTQELHEVLSIFEDQSIRAIPYKGPTLAEYAYGSLDARWFGDLDILVDEDDVLRARELLLERGYTQTNAKGIDPNTLVRESVFRWEQEFRFRKGNLRIELRFQLAGGDQPNKRLFEDLWQRRIELSLAGRTLKGLSPEDRLLLLLRHGTKHGWFRLSWAFDVSMVLQQEIQWDEVFGRAEEYGWMTAILLGLGMTAEVTDVEVPPEVRRDISANPRARWGTSMLIALLQKDPTGRAMDVDPITIVLFFNDSLRDSTRDLFDIIFSPSIATYQMAPLPQKLFILYYALRPVELGLKIIR